MTEESKKLTHYQKYREAILANTKRYNAIPENYEKKKQRDKGYAKRNREAYKKLKEMGLLDTETQKN